jgi:hypothetical protein
MMLLCLIVSVLVGILAWVAITAPNAPLPPCTARLLPVAGEIS